MRRVLMSGALMVLTCTWMLSGCVEPPGAENAGHGHDHSHGDGHDHDHDDHDHDDHQDDGHGHDHGAEGPHQGHIIELGTDELHAEWTHDDKTGLVTVYLLGADIKTPVAVAAEQLTITVKLPNQPQRDYQLAAKRDGDQTEGPCATFALQDAAMLTALKIGDAVDAFLVVPHGDKELRGKIEHHDHDHHDH